MRLLFKQRFFSWFDSYDIYNEAGETVYTVQGQLAWGHCLKIFDPSGREIGTVREKIFRLLPEFELYLGDTYVGSIHKEFTLFHPTFTIDCNGWYIEGDWLEWNYTIFASDGAPIATVYKEIPNWTDTYVIDVDDPEDALCALMLVLAIDAEKCSRN